MRRVTDPYWTPPELVRQESAALLAALENAAYVRAQHELGKTAIANMRAMLNGDSGNRHERLKAKALS